MWDWQREEPMALYEADVGPTTYSHSKQEQHCIWEDELQKPSPIERLLLLR